MNKLYDIVKNIKRNIVTTVMHGDNVICPICRKRLNHFLSFKGRANAKCPYCGSLERHRFLYIILEKMTDIFLYKLGNEPYSILHVSPEECLAERIKSPNGTYYKSIDLENGKALYQMDISCLRFLDNTFKYIICSHVLEHVKNDMLALKELHRVLHPDGKLFIMVPITSSTTFENHYITEPHLRRQAFGQEDHVRRYGLDFVDRVKSMGFKVTGVSPSEIVNRNYFGIKGAGQVFICSKR